MKKNRYLFLLTVALLVSMAGGTLTSRAAVGTINHTAIYEGTPLIGTDTLGGVTYTTFTYGDLLNGGEPGKPFLPIDYIRFSVPYNATGFTVTTTARPSVTHNLSHLVYPSQAPRLMSDTTPVTINLPDTAAYYSGGSYPSQLAWVVDEGFLDGENHIVTVAVLPFIYTHTSTYDRIVQKQRVYIQLHYTLGDSLAMYPIVRNDSLLREEGHRLAQSMVVNPTQVKAFAPQAPASAGIESLGYINGGIGGDGLNGGGITPVFPPIDPPTPIDTTHISTGEQYTEEDITFPYLIVTTAELKNSVRRIAALKRQKGYGVKVVTMDEVMNDSIAMNGDYVNGHYAFTDGAGKLRQYLRRAYTYSNTRFVLLAGHGVPYRTFQYGPRDIDSDLYFSDLTADWSDPYSEYSLFKIDKYPELFVGRILAYDSEEIMNYTDKLFRYELNPGKGDYNYLKKIFYSEALDFEDKNEWDSINHEYSSVFSSYTRFLEEKDSYFPSGTDIVNELNNTRYGYISLLNHAAPSGYVTYGQRHQDHDTSGKTLYYLWAIDSIHMTDSGFDTSDTHVGNGFNNLTNKWYPSICYSVGCFTMPFCKIEKFEDLRINCGESFTTGKDYGGPAFLGNTNEGASENTSTKLECYFAKQLQLSKGHYKIGRAEAFSKDDYYHDPSRNIPVILTHNLLGDPEFEIWTDIPQEFCNIEIERNDHSITISGIAADSCIVAYRSNCGFPEFHKVHSSSTVLNNVSPNGMVMLYTHNYIPYIAPLELQNETINSSKYVIASDVTAGSSINSGRPNGNVIVKSGTNYEIEASGTVRLEDGFVVEKGAKFAVYPSSF